MSANREQIAKLKLYEDSKNNLASLGYVECVMCGELIKAPTKAALTRRKYCNSCRYKRYRASVKAKRTTYLEESDEHKYNPSSDILTHYSFKYLFKEDEYKSFGQFLASRCVSSGSTMIVIKVNNKKYSLCKMPINTYSKQDTLEKAKKWVNNPRSGMLRRATLSKFIEIVEKDM